jgi:hypothetical protein
MKHPSIRDIARFCKGCHGVAQTAFGTDFNFLLDFGAGKPVNNPDTIFYHPDEP